MVSLSKLFARWVSRRQNGTIPAKCYPICQNALTAAQIMGKTEALCAPDSEFQLDYSTCITCIVGHGGSASNASSYLSTTFQEFINYCDAPTVQRVTATLELTLTGGQRVPLSTITTDITITGSLTETVVSTTSGNTTLTSTPLTSANSTISTSPPITTGSNLIPTAEPTTSAKSDSGSKAWVAGPVVGSIAGVAVVALGIFLWYRRRMARRKPQAGDLTDKPQLHSDCVPRQPPDELDAGMRHELPGDEPGKWNAPISELPVDNATLEKKTYGKNELPSYEPEKLPS